MINVELNIRRNDHILISIDKEGQDELLAMLAQLVGRDDHVHLFCPSWSTPEGAELSEVIFTGEEYHWCHELSIGAPIAYVNDDERIALFVDVSISNKEYSALQVSLTRTQAELSELMRLITELSADQARFSLDLQSRIEIKRESHETEICNQMLRLEFQYAGD